tara:strand:- start:365 stop:2356 length:1992 start_codon:yes stop_codon:yes gene_type:complete
VAVAQSDIDPAAEPEAKSDHVTLRSVILGLITAAVMSWSGNLLEMVLHAGSLVKSSYPVALTLWFCIWIMINMVLGLVRPAWMLTKVELLVIFGTIWIAGMMPGVGWMGYLIGALPAPHFFATPENRWEELFFDQLPMWAFPNPTAEIMDRFYFGLHEGESVPWGAWIMPVWWWFSGALALVGAGYFVVCIFHRQWVDAERLTYPLVQFPEDLVEGFDQGRRVPDILKKPVFWYGFAWTAGIILWNVINYWYPNIPRIDLFDNINVKSMYFARNFPPFYARILPPVIGLGYLCSLDLLFSFWFFGILALLKVGTFTRTGLTIGLEGQPSKAGEIIALESHGAMTVLVIWSLWLARRHIRQVWQEARTGVKGDGPIPYRVAVIGLAFCAVYACSFLMKLGMSFHLAMGQLTLMFIAYFATVKYMAASGFGYLFPVWTKGGSFLKIVTGTARMSTGDLTALRLADSPVLFGGTRLQTLQMLPHHMRAMDNVVRGKGWVSGIVFAAFITAFIASAMTIIYYCYIESALFLRSWTLWEGPHGIFGGIATSLAVTEKTVFDPQKMGMWILGGAEATFLAVMRSRFAWWPFHPLGLAFQYTTGPRYYALSIFIVWAAKLIILRTGGPRLYEKAKPFFIGTVVGYAMGILVGMVIDLIWFPGEGHGFHNF